MNYRLIPRFNYTLPFSFYLKLQKKGNNTNNMCAITRNGKIYQFNQARVGLRVLLSAISKKRINVGVQAFTCHTVFQAIHNSGHNIVFIDITDDFKLNLLDLKSKIDIIDVLIVTHTFGYPENMDEIKKITNEKIIIEDCSHSFLSKYKDQYTGTIGDAAIFSTGLAKFPPIGAGGFCLVNNLKMLVDFESEYSRIPKPLNIQSLNSFIKSVLSSILLKPPLFGLFAYKIIKIIDQKYDVGNKFSFTETRGCKWVEVLFNNNLDYFLKESDKKRRNFELMKANISNKNSIIQFPKSHSPNYYIFPFLSNNRDEIYDELLENNIQTGKHFHRCIAWGKGFGYKDGECPNTESISQRIITLPIHSIVRKKNTLSMIKLLG